MRHKDIEVVVSPTPHGYRDPQAIATYIMIRQPGPGPGLDPVILLDEKNT